MNRYRIFVFGAATLSAALWAYACGDGTTEPPPSPPDPPRPTTVTVSPATAELVALGATVQLSAEVRDQTGQVMAGATVTWASSAASVATVSSTGLVTAVDNGTATITATAGSVSGMATVTVAQEVSAVAVAPAADTLVVGDTLRLDAEAADANGHPVADVEVAWASSDTLVAVVDDAGLVTGIGAGEVEATATAAGVTGRAELMVVDPAPTTVAVTPDTVALTALGQTIRLSAEVRDQEGRVMDGVAVSWSSADTTVAAVDSAGLVTAVGGGETTIHASAGEATGEALVTVMQSAGTVTVSPAADTVPLGETVRLVAEAFDENGHPVEGAKFNWSSSDVSVAKVDGSGLVTGVVEGTATITAVAGDAWGTAEITVTNPDRAALEVLYHATGGPEWTNASGWLTDAPLRDWHGVATDGRGRVTRLSLSTNGLMGWLPPEVGSLSQLADLSLSQNRLTGPIPPELGSLSNLRTLNLLYTDLSGPIPPELGDLSALTSLLIAQTAIRGPGVDGAIPPELGQLSRLRTLWLHGNRLTGPIPPQLGNLRSLQNLFLGTHPDHGTGHTGPIPSELGNLRSLRALRLQQNSLSGPIPPELGGLSALVTLHLYDNQLTGPIPPELGQLSSVEHVDVSGNRLTGAIPDSFGDMTRLGSLILSFNPGLSGALPLSLRALAGLRTLFATGTELCAPGDVAFVRWLNGIPRKRIPSCADENAAPVYLTQAVQSRSFPVGLVAGDSALLRVFVAEPRAAGAPMPLVRATFFIDGLERHVADIPGQATPIPAEIDEGNLSKSANADIPGEIVQPGLEMVIEVDPAGTLDPGLGVAKRIPATGRMAVDVHRVPSLELTMVPFIWSTAPDSAILDLAAELSPEHSLFWMTRDLLPVRDFEFRVHESVVTSTNVPFTLLGEARAIRAVEGGAGYWWATMSSQVRGSPGLSGGDGVIFATPFARVVAHEFGHEFDLNHAPCGGASSPDTSYPFSDGSIGAWGYAARSGELVAPGTPDLMSYCHPPWISEFHFSNALGYRTSVEGTPQASSGPAAAALLLWGGVDGEGQPYLEPAFFVNAPPSLPLSGGGHEITGRDAGGRELFSLRFDMAETTDGDGGSSFALALPAAPGWPGHLASITLTGRDGSVTLNGESDVPMAILRNPRTGQVRGILRDLSAPTQVAIDAVWRTAGPGLEVLFSRGIPGAEAWRR